MLGTLVCVSKTLGGKSRAAVDKSIRVWLPVAMLQLLRGLCAMNLFSEAPNCRHSCSSHPETSSSCLPPLPSLSDRCPPTVLPTFLSSHSSPLMRVNLHHVLLSGETECEGKEDGAGEEVCELDTTVNLCFHHL